MFLKSIYISGFKSFANPTTIEFDTKLNAVVGPNGSGKSNIVDAILWVMGEQGVKNLRSAKMQDVIFSGTKTRSQLGRATVSLVIDNKDKKLPLDFTEIKITRTIYRDGNSAYFINDAPVRLLEIQELFSDIGIGSLHHVLVGQGTLDSILYCDPQTRRGFIEEAAGIAKYKKRREKSKRKIKAANENLERLYDISHELKKRLRPLKSQAKATEKANVIKKQTKDTKERILFFDLLNSVMDTEYKKASLAETEKEIKGVSDSISLCEKKIGEANELAEKVKSDYDECSKNFYKIQNYKNILNEKNILFGQKIQSLNDVLSKTIQDINAEEYLNSVEEHRKNLALFNEFVEEKQNDIQKLRQKKDEYKEKSVALDQRIFDLEAQIKRNEAKKIEYTRYLESAAVRIENLKNDIEDEKISSAELLAELKTVEEEYESKKEEFERLEKETSKISDEEKAAGIKIDEAQNKISSITNESESLRIERENLSAKLDAYNSVYKEKTANLESIIDKTDANLSLFTSKIKVQPGYENAVLSALDKINESLIADNIDNAIQIIHFAKSKKLGKVNLFINGNGTSDKNSITVSTAEKYGVKLLSEVTELDDSINGVSDLISEFIVVETLDAGKKILEENHDAKIVTLAGDYLSYNFLSGGEIQESNTLLIKSGINNIEKSLRKCEKELEKVETDLVAEQEKFNKLSEEYQELVLKQKTYLQKTDTAKNDLASITLQKENKKLQVEYADKKTADLENTLKQIEIEKADAEEKLNSLSEDNTERIEQEIKTLEGEKIENVQLLENTTIEYNELILMTESHKHKAQFEQEQIAMLEKKYDLTVENQRIEKENKEKAKKQIEIYEKFRSLIEPAQKLNDVALTRLRDKQTKFKADIEKINFAAKDIERVKSEFSQKLNSLYDTKNDKTVAASVSQEKLNKIQREIDYEMSASQEELLNKYKDDYSDYFDISASGTSVHTFDETDGEVADNIGAGAAENTEAGVAGESGEASSGGSVFLAGLKITKTASDEDCNEKLNELHSEHEVQKSKLEKIGNINPFAIDEYNAQKERYDFLSEQISDIENTRENLKKVVSELDIFLEDSFQSAFVDIQKEFSETFSRLFEGGKGELRLLRPEKSKKTPGEGEYDDLSDVSDEEKDEKQDNKQGVEIFATPKGKRPKRISLLSGGERALTAIALLVSIYKTFPNPFYVFDEIEAALDDINLSRLLYTLEDLKTVSQILIITHQKRTMEIADAIHGVSSDKDGVTVVVSEKLK